MVGSAVSCINFMKEFSSKNAIVVRAAKRRRGIVQGFLCRLSSLAQGCKQLNRQPHGKQRFPDWRFISFQSRPGLGLHNNRKTWHSLILFNTLSVS